MARHNGQRLARPTVPGRLLDRVDPPP